MRGHHISAQTSPVVPTRAGTVRTVAATSSVLRRCCVMILGLTLAACGGDDDTDSVSADDGATSSTSAPDATETESPDTDGGAPVTPAELEFRPVLQLLPPGGVPAAAGGSTDDGCTTPDDAWSADQQVLAPQVEGGAEIACLELGPAEVDGGIVESAAAVEDGLGNWMISLVLTTDGIVPFNETIGDCFDGAATCPTRQLAIVVDRAVISAPSINAPEFERDAISISGQFTRADAEALAERLG